jgi:hypothetical protein
MSEKKKYYYPNRAKEHYYPNPHILALVNGVSEQMGISKSKLVSDALKAYFATLKPEIIEAAKFKQMRAKQNAHE